MKPTVARTNSVKEIVPYGRKEESVQVPFPTYAKFLCGGLAGMGAAFCVHPMDFMKTRMQMSGTGGEKKLYSSTGDALVKIVKSEGLLAIYDGASACIARQAVYTTTRLGVYTTLLGLMSKEGEPPSFGVKAAIGMFSGLCAGFLSTPMDLCVIRMIADGAKPPEQKFNYNHVFHGLYKIARDEGGLKGLYRGALPTTFRAIVVNGSVLATYSQAKQLLASYGQKEGFMMQVNASIISGFVTSIVSLPVDIIKTRVQAQKGNEAKLSVAQIFFGILKNEGPFAFWKGLTPYFIRLAPITILTFIFVEKLTYWYHIHILGNKNPRSNL